MKPFLPLALAIGMLLAGCAGEPDAPVDEYETAQTMCVIAHDLIIEEHQPQNAEAWHNRHPAMCDDLAEAMGKQEFIDSFNDPEFVTAYVEAQTN